MITTSELATAAEAISSYTYGMDTGNWDLAVSAFTDTVDVDYSAVGALSGRLTRADLKAFLKGLLGKENLRVHTAVSQIFVDPADLNYFVAYYSVRHYRTEHAATQKFALFGWYRYQLKDSRINSLSIYVSATEGDPATLA